MSLSNLSCKIIVALIFIFFAKFSLAQPLFPPQPFEDSYEGKADCVIKSAKVKIKKTYYKLDSSQPAALYHTFEYNKEGFLINQKWYNLLSNKEMYSASYIYGSDNFIISCVEKITNEFDDFKYYARQLGNDGYFLSNATGNALGEPIPIDKDGNTFVKTTYAKDSLGGYFARKYFCNDSVYKEKLSPTLEYGPDIYENLYINQDKGVDYVYADSFYKADTVYKSNDTLNISVKTKRDKLECFKILKVKNNNKFVVTDIDRVLVKMKLHFSYRNSFIDNKGFVRREIKSITYINYDAVDIRLLLVHKFDDLDHFQSQLNAKIELTEMKNQDYFIRAEGCVFYTKFKEGNLFSEEQYSLGNDKIRKLKDVKYTHHNLISEKTCYNACFGLQPLSKALTYDGIDSIQEINIYDYFEK